MGRLRGEAKRRRTSTRGSVLLDVLAALLIASSALLICLGGFALAARSAGRAYERAYRLIAARNEYAQNRATVFAAHPAEE